MAAEILLDFLGHSVAREGALELFRALYHQKNNAASQIASPLNWLSAGDDGSRVDRAAIDGKAIARNDTTNDATEATEHPSHPFTPTALNTFAGPWARLRDHCLKINGR